MRTNQVLRQLSKRTARKWASLSSMLSDFPTAKTKGTNGQELMIMDGVRNQHRVVVGAQHPLTMDGVLLIPVLRLLLLVDVEVVEAELVAEEMAAVVPALNVEKTDICLASVLKVVEVLAVVVASNVAKRGTCLENAQKAVEVMVVAHASSAVKKDICQGSALKEAEEDALIVAKRDTCRESAANLALGKC